MVWRGVVDEGEGTRAEAGEGGNVNDDSGNQKNENVRAK